MYRDGIGVAEDPFEQAAWQTKLLKKREEAYTTEKTADTFTLYVRELVGIAQDWEKLNMRKDAAQLYETAVALCQAPAKDCDPNKYFSAYLFSLRGCSEIFIQDKAYEKAESYLDRAAIELKRCEGNGVAVLSSELKRTLGHLYRSLGKYSEAEECYRSMIDLYRSQEQEFGKPYADRNTAVAFWEIAKNQELQGKNAEACASYHNALVLLRPILSNEGYQLAALQDLVIISRSLAMLEEQASHYDAAKDILNAAILQIQEVPEWENRSEIAYYIWVLMVSLGELYNRVLDWDHATETYVAARKIRQLLRAEPATIQTLWENHIRQSRKADSYAAEGNNIGAKAAYLQSLKYAQLLEEKECSFHSSYGVWTELEKLVNFLAETNDSDFLQHMLHAIGIVGALAVESNSSPMYDRMAQLYIQTANYYYQAGDLQNAFKFYKSAKLVSEKRLAITTTYICVECLADANLGIGLIMNSKEFLESAHAMWSILCEQVSRSHPDATEQLRRYQKRRAFAAQCLHSFEQRAPGNC
jgi:tetratricopeptide (TPR) repeat protein